VSARPLPRPTELSQPHWEGCREGVLRVQRCLACGAHVFIPEPLCTACFSGELAWVESRGHGSVYSFTIVHRAPHPAFATPYLVAIVALDEGFEMLANLDCDPALAAIGMRVRVEFRAVSEAISLPCFVPHAEHSSHVA
jgi:uncharacterized OB-fold protein